MGVGQRYQTGTSAASQASRPATAGISQSAVYQLLCDEHDRTCSPVHTPLLTFKHVEGVPGLARTLPQVTNGGKTYALRLSKGLKYSDGTAVRASDFEHAIKRVLY